QRLAALFVQIGRQRPRQRFRGLRLAAAGSETPDMQRLGEALAELAEVPVDPEGALLVRVRRGPGRPGTGQVLVRSTPLPRSTRARRAVNYPGAANATLAAT